MVHRESPTRGSDHVPFAGPHQRVQCGPAQQRGSSPCPYPTPHAASQPGQNGRATATSGGVSALRAPCVHATIEDPHAALWRRDLSTFGTFLPWNRDSRQEKIPNMASLRLTRRQLDPGWVGCTQCARGADTPSIIHTPRAWVLGPRSIHRTSPSRTMKGVWAVRVPFVQTSPRRTTRPHEGLPPKEPVQNP